MVLGMSKVVPANGIIFDYCNIYCLDIYMLNLKHWTRNVIS